MRFKIDFFKTSFLVSFLKSNTTVNYPENVDYDWKKDIVYDSLSLVKRALRDKVNHSQLTELERYWVKDYIKNLNLELLIDEELDAYTRLEKEYKVRLK